MHEKDVKRCVSSRSRRQLSNEYFLLVMLAKLGVDTAENEPSKVPSFLFKKKPTPSRQSSFISISRPAKVASRINNQRILMGRMSSTGEDAVLSDLSPREKKKREKEVRDKQVASSTHLKMDSVKQHITASSAADAARTQRVARLRAELKVAKEANEY